MSNVYHKSRMAEKKKKYLEHRTSIENDVILAGGKEIQKGSLHAVVFCLDKDRALFDYVSWGDKVSGPACHWIWVVFPAVR